MLNVLALTFFPKKSGGDRKSKPASLKTRHLRLKRDRLGTARSNGAGNKKERSRNVVEFTKPLALETNRVISVPPFAKKHLLHKRFVNLS